METTVGVDGTPHGVEQCRLTRGPPGRVGLRSSEPILGAPEQVQTLLMCVTQTQGDRRRKLR